MACFSEALAVLEAQAENNAPAQGVVRLRWLVHDEQLRIGERAIKSVEAVCGEIRIRGLVNGVVSARVLRFESP